MNNFPPEKYCADLQCWAPLVLQNVEAYSAKLVNIGVVYLCQESDLHSAFHLLYTEDKTLSF